MDLHEHEPTGSADPFISLSNLIASASQLPMATGRIIMPDDERRTQLPTAALNQPGATGHRVQAFRPILLPLPPNYPGTKETCLCCVGGGGGDGRDGGGGGGGGCGSGGEKTWKDFPVVEGTRVVKDASARAGFKRVCTSDKAEFAVNDTCAAIAHLKKLGQGIANHATSGSKTQGGQGSADHAASDAAGGEGCEEGGGTKKKPRRRGRGT